MADATKKKRTFRKFSFRGKSLDELLELQPMQLRELITCRARRNNVRVCGSAQRIKKLEMFFKKLRKSKRNLEDGEKPPTIKTHMRNVIIIPEMIGSVVGVYN